MKTIFGVALGATLVVLAMPIAAQPKVPLSAVDVRAADIQRVLKTARADAADRGARPMGICRIWSYVQIQTRSFPLNE